jgi:hypothetical protein
MNTPLPRPRAALLAALASLGLLAACGDDPYEAEPPAPPVAEDTVPASATASTTAFVQFTASLPADDRADPRRLDGVTPPTSETADPEPVN